MTDSTKAALTPAERAMLDFAVALTRDPSATRREDLEVLRRHGFDDVAIHDIVQVVAVFNYYNRIANGLGIEDEPDWE